MTAPGCAQQQPLPLLGGLKADIRVSPGTGMWHFEVRSGGGLHVDGERRERQAAEKEVSAWLRRFQPVRR